MFKVPKRQPRHILKMSFSVLYILYYTVLFCTVSDLYFDASIGQAPPAVPPFPGRPRRGQETHSGHSGRSGWLRTEILINIGDTWEGEWVNKNYLPGESRVCYFVPSVQMVVRLVLPQLSLETVWKWNFWKKSNNS